MQVSPVSFQGLWKGPVSQEKMGMHSRYGSPVYVDTFEYCAFKDETQEDALKVVQNANKAIFAMDDDRNNDPYGPEEYHVADVKLGERLNITAEDYEKVLKLNSEMYSNNSFLTYSRLTKAESKNLMMNVI